MTNGAFRKALHERPLSQQEQDELTPHELFVLVLSRRLDRLKDAEWRKLKPEDFYYLARGGDPGIVSNACGNGGAFRGISTRSALGGMTRRIPSLAVAPSSSSANRQRRLQQPDRGGVFVRARRTRSPPETEAA